MTTPSLPDLPASILQAATTSNSNVITIDRLEKVLLRDIKLALRAGPPSRLQALLDNWAKVSSRDCLVEVGMQFISKERHLGERVLLMAFARGPLEGRVNRVVFAIGVVYLATIQFYLSKWDESKQTLHRAILLLDAITEELTSPTTSLTTQTGPPPIPATPTVLNPASLPSKSRKSSTITRSTSSLSSLSRLSSAQSLTSIASPKTPHQQQQHQHSHLTLLTLQTSLHLCIISLLLASPDPYTTLKTLSRLHSPTLVLEQQKHAFIELIRAMAYVQMGDLEEAVKVLERRRGVEMGLEGVRE
ncbi:hypothetical protein HK097_004910, partial [Rhizophlyctis rosea]